MRAGLRGRWRRPWTRGKGTSNEPKSQVNFYTKLMQEWEGGGRNFCNLARSFQLTFTAQREGHVCCRCRRKELRMGHPKDSGDQHSPMFWLLKTRGNPGKEVAQRRPWHRNQECQVPVRQHPSSRHGCYSTCTVQSNRGKPKQRLRSQH